MPSKALVEVEIPDGFEVAEPKLRVAVADDFWLVADGVTVGYCGNWPHIEGVKANFWSTEPRVILRPAWEWPAWLIANWIAMDASGDWHVYMKEPQLRDDGCVPHWATNGFSATLIKEFLDFPGPPCTDFRQSKRKNPSTP